MENEDLLYLKAIKMGNLKNRLVYTYIPVASLDQIMAGREVRRPRGVRPYCWILWFSSTSLDGCLVKFAIKTKLILL